MEASQRRIAGAFLVGGGLILFAFVMKPTATPEPVANQGLVAVASPGAAREYLQVADQDNDGIPDWQEALQRTEPVVIQPIDTEYEPPDTMTDEFARTFFEDMVRSENYGAFSAGQDTIINRAVDRFAEQSQDELFGVSDITIIANNSPESIRSYVNVLATIALDQQRPAELPNEYDILSRAYNTNNPEVLKELEPIIDDYTSMVTRIQSLAVPSSYASAHLDMLNAMNAVRIDITAMKEAFADPLYTMVRLKRFREDASAMYLTIINLQKQILEDGVEFRSTDPIWRLVVQ